MPKSKWSEDEAPLLPKFDRALALRDNREFDAAIELLSEVIAGISRSDSRLAGHAEMQVGHIWKNELSDSSKAEPHFRAAVTAMPRSELASMALFHVLLSLRRSKEAMTEMVRFVSARDSKGYRELLADGFGTGRHPFRRFADHARLLLSLYEGI